MYGLTVDGREPPHVFEAFSAENVPFIRTNLDVGDFEISDPEKGVAVIVERKTWSDLVSSLTGQRLGEQTARIVEKCRETGARPVLLVEHEKVPGWEGAHGGTSNKFVECTLVKYALEGFSVVRTKNVNHTKDVVLWMLDRCKNGKVPSFTPDYTFRGEAGGKKFRKKDYGNPWQTMLTAIRGVSPAKAKDIAAKYPNALELSNALRESSDLKIKGIGKKLSSDIRKALLG
jgi:ERCC4-type nuclease